MSIFLFRFQYVENFFAVREVAGPDDLIIAEDYETTIKIQINRMVYKNARCTQIISREPRLAVRSLF